MSDRLKVLVVDDDRMMVKTICDILTIKGYEPVAAYCGEEAVEKVKAGRPACVLMDLKIPGIDGVEALRVIREIDAELPVVLMSAYATVNKRMRPDGRGPMRSSASRSTSRQSSCLSRNSGKTFKLSVRSM